MKTFKIKTLRCEWQVVIQHVDQYGMSTKDRTVLDIWPTYEEAKADLPNHGKQSDHVFSRWIPNIENTRYVVLEIQYREVEV